MAITNYAIIDHAGQVSAISEIYKKAFSMAIGFDKVYTLKKVCQMSSPYAKEVTDKMKFYNRYTKHPKKVYLICSFVDSKAEFIADIWRDRDIEVEFVTEEPEPQLYLETISRARRCAMIWGSALGWTFSAPLFRDEQPINIDMYTARPKRHNDAIKDEPAFDFSNATEEDAELVEFIKEMNEKFPAKDNSSEMLDEYIEDGSYGAKRFTKPESFQSVFREIASEDECKAFFQHYKWLYENNLLAESLEPDWELCPVCGRPHHLSSERCPWCDTEFESIECETFYEDHDGYDTPVYQSLYNSSLTEKDILNLADILDIKNENGESVVLDNYSHADMAIKAYPKRKVLIDLFDEGCHFPDVKNFYI